MRHFLCALVLLVPVAAQAQVPDTSKARPDSARAKPDTGYSQQEPYVLDSLVATGKPSTNVGPLPGLNLRIDQMPANIQSADQENIKESRAFALTDFMNFWMASVSVNDYQGNPFQADVVFRGFSASPQLGTPQGLSVFFDGVRVNEAFGDVVNWDLLPLNAVSQVRVFPGSSPLFGLNTLGGALSLRSRDGFSDAGFEVTALGGTYGRKQLQGAVGGHTEKLGGFLAVNWFDEDGWRDNSPSKLLQGFGRVDYRSGRTLLTGTALLGSNDLVGNGLIPYDLWLARPENVFSSPDETRNKLAQFTGTGQFFLGSHLNITTQLYTRSSNRTGIGGDVYTDGFESFTERDAQRTEYLPHDLPYCQYVDADGNGLPDTGVPLNAPCDQIQVGDGIPRNGAEGDDFLPPVLKGIIDGTPVGVLSATALGQRTSGAGLQFNWNFEKNKFLVGGSLDDGSSNYSLTQQLALIDANRNVVADPDHIDPYYRAAQVPILVNAFSGKSTTWSAYVSETWSPTTKIDFTVAARYNWVRVRNSLDTRSLSGQFNGDLHDITNRNVRFPRILCPTADPASCPDSAYAVYPNFDTLQATQTEGLTEVFNYPSFNPSVGVSYRPATWLNFYGNLSRGARAPSVIELGCAFDATPVNIWDGFVGDDGQPHEPEYVARSLVGPTCTLPGALSGDPYLPQVRSTSGEIGARGGFLRDWEWTAAMYRTDLQDDIQFVAASPQRSFFQSVGNTRRQGFEVGIAGTLKRFGLRANYSYVDATYQSTFYLLSPNNSSADFNQNSQPISDVPTSTATANNGIGTYRMIRVDPGAHLPGVPRHNVNARVDYQVLRPWNVGLNMFAHSRAYLRGNENNRHTTGGTDQEAPLYRRDDRGVIEAVGSVDPGREFTLEGSVPGFAVFGLTSDLRITKSLVVSLVVMNLFDTSYFTAGRLGITPFSQPVNGAVGPSGWNYNSNEWANTSFVAPGAPIGLWITANYQFSTGAIGGAK